MARKLICRQTRFSGKLTPCHDRVKPKRNQWLGSTAQTQAPWRALLCDRVYIGIEKMVKFREKGKFAMLRSIDKNDRKDGFVKG